jgi:hypothetical protein
MYVEPLTAPEVKHNFKLLVNKFKMFDPDCPDCDATFCEINDFGYIINMSQYLLTQNFEYITTQDGDRFVWT